MNEFLIEHADLLKYKTVFMVITFVLCLVAFVCSAIGFYKRQTITDKVKNAKMRFDEGYQKRTLSRYVSDYFNNAFSRHLDSVYKYSRFFKTKTKLVTSALYWFVGAMISLGSFLLTLAIAKKISLAFVIGVFFAMLWYGRLYIRCYRNRKSVSKDLVPFLNLLGNYSTGNSEITTIFMQIAPKMHYPLNDCLIECVAEAQNIEGGKSRALENLINKIDHRKFCEIIKNLEISERYTNSFVVVARQTRGNLTTYIRAEKESKELVEQDLIIMCVCVALMIGIIAVLGTLIDEGWFGVFVLMGTTTLGNIVLLIAIFCIAVFVKKVIEVNV